MTSTQNPVKGQRITFSGKEQVSLQPFDLAAPAATEVLVKTDLSLMSTGTETIVFSRNFDNGTHWDKWIKYPFYPGYSAVGTVVQTGSAVTTLKAGDRVALRCPHQSHTVLDAEGCIPVPASVDAEHAVWFALAKIAFHGAQAAQYRLGDSVLVVGAGPIGQMSVRWAMASATAKVFIADPIESRMSLAARAGATPLRAALSDAAEELRSHNGGSLPRIVLDSTGNAAVFSASLTLAENYGTLVLLGDTGQPSHQHLTSDLIMRGLHVVGAHDTHSSAQWNDATIARLFFTLVADGRIRLDNLISHRFAPADCAAAYRTASRERASTMGILFNWNQSA